MLLVSGLFLDRSTLLLADKTPKPNTKAIERVPLVVTNSNLQPNIHSIVNKHFQILYESDRMRGVFKEPQIVAYRRARHLCDTLVYGKTNSHKI
jgi:hypothetical protein